MKLLQIKGASPPLFFLLLVLFVALAWSGCRSLEQKCAERYPCTTVLEANYQLNQLSLGKPMQVAIPVSLSFPARQSQQTVPDTKLAQLREGDSLVLPDADNKISLSIIRDSIRKSLHFKCRCEETTRVDTIKRTVMIPSPLARDKLARSWWDELFIWTGRASITAVAFAGIYSQRKRIYASWQKRRPPKKD